MKFSVKLIIALVVIVGITLCAAWMGMRYVSGGSSAEYTAVYLRTGEIYIGKVSWFPRPTMREAWYVQRGVDNQNQPQLGLAPFKGVFWGPGEELHLNPSEIVWWAPLRTDSDVAKAMREAQTAP